MKRKKLKINLLFEIKKLKLAVRKFLKVNMNISWFSKTDNTFQSPGCAKTNPKGGGMCKILGVLMSILAPHHHSIKKY